MINPPNIYNRTHMYIYHQWAIIFMSGQCFGSVYEDSSIVHSQKIDDFFYNVVNYMAAVFDYHDVGIQ